MFFAADDVASCFVEIKSDRTHGVSPSDVIKTTASNIYSISEQNFGNQNVSTKILFAVHSYDRF